MRNTAFWESGVLVAVLALVSGCGPRTHTRVTGQATPKSFQTFAQEAGAKPTPDCDETCTKRRTEFRYVVYVAKEIYCYWDLKKAETHTDFDALAAFLEKSITNSTTSSEYYVLLRKWASAFHDGHVNVLYKEDVTGLEIYSAPIRVEVLAPATDHEKVVVVKIEGNASGVAVGDEIRAINGVKIADALTEVAAIASSGSTERMRRYSAGRRLVDAMGVERGSEPLVLDLVDTKGQAKKATLSRKIQIDAKPARSATATADATGAEKIQATILPGMIGYLRIDGFSGSQDEFLLDQVMDRKANGLATFVGEPTGGGTGTPLVFELPVSGFLFRYSVIRGQTPRGEAIEGVGTSPDVYIETSLEDRLSATADSQLAKALEVLGSKMQGGLPLPGAALSPMRAVWDQDLHVSPTSQENRDLLDFASRDEL